MHRSRPFQICHPNLTFPQAMLPTTVQILYKMLPLCNLSKRLPPAPSKATVILLLRSTARKLLSRQQLIGTKRHRQKLFQGHDRVLAQLVVHQYRRVGLRDYVSRNTFLGHHLHRYGEILLTSQNSRINCLHMPQGLAGGEMSVATAMARKSPALAP